MKKIISLFLAVVMAVSVIAGMNISVYAEEIDYAQQLIDMIENCNLKDVIYPAYDNKEHMNYMINLAAEIKEDAKTDSYIQSLKLNDEEKIVAAISEYVNEHIKEYGYWASDRTGYTALEGGQGNCMNFALCCFELCRFAGIEAYEIDATNRGHEIILVHCKGNWKYVDVTGGTRWYTVDTIKTSSCNSNGEPYKPTGIRTQFYDILYSTHFDPTVQKYFGENEKILCYCPELKDIRYMNKNGEVVGMPENGWSASGYQPYKYENGKLYMNEEYYYKGIRYRGFRTIDSKEYCFKIDGGGLSQSLDYSHIYISPDIQFNTSDCKAGESTAVKYKNTVLNSTESYEIGLITKSNPTIGKVTLNCSGEARLSADKKTLSAVSEGYVYLVAVSKVTGEMLAFQSVDIECSHVFDSGVVIRNATCLFAGLKEFTCTKCGYVETVEIQGPPHKAVWENQFGYLNKYCTECRLMLVQLDFCDIGNCEAYGDYIEYTSVLNKFITGTNPPYYTEFSPTAPITRAMFVTILYRMAGSPYDNGRNLYSDNPFSDVPENAYYYNPACWALKNGITTQTVFKPYNNVSREQTASFLFRYAQNSGYVKDEQYKKVVLTGFYDYADVRDWALESLQWANYNGMITGTRQNTLNPQGATQRVHATKILYGFGKACGIGNFE